MYVTCSKSSNLAQHPKPITKIQHSSLPSASVSQDWRFIIHLFTFGKEKSVITLIWSSKCTCSKNFNLSRKPSPPPASVTYPIQTCTVNIIWISNVKVVSKLDLDYPDARNWRKVYLLSCFTQVGMWSKILSWPIIFMVNITG